MDLSKLIAQANAKAQSSPTYQIAPKHATLIEYQIQRWTGDVWVTIPGQVYEGLAGFSDAAKVIRAMRGDGDYFGVVLRIIGICEVKA